MIDETSVKRLSIERRLEEAADTALADASRQWEQNRLHYPSLLEMAVEIYRGRQELMEEAKEGVLLDRLVWILKRRKSSRREREFHQYQLPDVLTPKTVYLKDGSRPRTDYCDARRLDEAIRVMKGQARERQTPKLRSLLAARELMEPYRLENSQITWGEVKRKELERRDFDRLVGE